MQIEDLFEGGVKTAELDTLTRRALMTALPDVVRTIIDEITPHLPPARAINVRHEDDREYEERSETNERIVAYIDSHPELPIRLFGEAIQDIFAGVVKTYASRLLPTIPGIFDYCRFLNVRDPDEAIVNHIKVKIEQKETSTDRYKTSAAGYYSGFSTLIKVFVDAETLLHTMQGYLYESLYGEDSENYRALLFTKILPTFLHEYAHFEQDIRSRSNWYSRQMRAKRAGKTFDKQRGGDFLHITPRGAAKGRGRSQGKRGGLARDPGAGHGEFAQYLGSGDEIDSWATSAAAQLMDELQDEQANREGWRAKSPEDINRSILNIQRNLAIGSYSHYESDAIGEYKELVRRAFNGFFDEVKGTEYPQQDDYPKYDPSKRVVIDRKQIEKVYKLFSRKVAVKLEHYKKKTTGEDHPQIDKALLDLVRGESTKDGVQFLARRTAHRIVDDQDTWGMSPDRILSGTSDEMYKVEDFIRDHYIKDANHEDDSFKKWLQGDDYYDLAPDWRHREARTDKLMMIFRRLVLRNLERIDPERFSREAIDQALAA